MPCRIKALSALKQRIFHTDNIVGVGVGPKEVGGNCTEKICAVVLVKRKLPESKISRKEVIPQSLHRMVTDVIEVGEITLLNKPNRVSRQRPAYPGLSIGHFKITAGTFGAVVKDNKTNSYLILSNNHVLANETDGKDGRSMVGDPILQPGRYDGGSQADIIGFLDRYVPLWRVSHSSRCRIAMAAEKVSNMALRMVQPNYSLKLERKSRKENLVDAALAKPVSDEVIVDTIAEIGKVKGIREAEIGMELVKSGRTSGLTRGKVKLVNATIKVNMGDVGEAVFTDQIITTPMGEPGDSGSLVLTPEGEAVGLLAAGSEYVTVLGRIQNVLNLLDVTLV